MIVLLLQSKAKPQEVEAVGAILEVEAVGEAAMVVVHEDKVER